MLARCAILSMFKQMHLSDVVQQRSWKFDLAGPLGGLLRFGEELSFKAQILGTESADSDTFRWAWVNGDIPPALVEASRALHAALPPEFRVAQFPLAQASGMQLGAVACDQLNAAAYYSGPTGPTGRVILLITDPSFPLHEPGDAVRCMTAITQSVQLGWVRNHRQAVDHFFQSLQWRSDGAGTYSWEGGSSLTTDFTEEGLLKGVRANIVKT